MKKGYIRMVVAVVVAVMCGTVGMTAGKGGKETSSGDRAKARYYYVEGSVALAEGRPAEAYELIKKAALTDPSYAEANYTYALMRMTLRNDTLSTPTEVGRSISLMKSYVDQYPKETEEAMNYSFLVARTGDLDEAIRVAERSDTLAGSLPSILLQLAQYYTAKQDYDKGISTLERYERIEGNDPDIALRKFSLMYMKGDTARIISESDRLVKENPLSTDYLLIRGNAMEALEMPDSALASYQRAEALDPDDGRVKLTLANYYLQMGDSAAYDQKSSEAILSENIMLEEKLDMMTRYMQNIISDTTADSRRGARLFDGLLKQYPHEPQVLDLGAKYSATVGDYARARELMAYATDLEPENPDYWTRLAHFNFADDRYAEAVEICEKAMGKLPEVPRGLLLVYGTACSMSEQYEKARDAYQKLLEMELPDASLTDDAQTVLQKAAKLPYESLIRTAEIFQMVGDGSFKTGDIARSTKEYDVVLTLNPENVIALNNYAYYLAIGGGDLDKAEELSRKAVAEQPENPTYLDTLAWILYLKGEYTEALEIQEKAMANITPEAEGTGEYWDHMGDIQYMNGQKDQAVESWKKALEVDKGNKEIEQKIKDKRINTKDKR
ncbi:MAG: tetratricopeptide repeat protein [Muribaculaceae bacterium]|nr:tetratricopeptide repeat protein [Muribaculaceae bacterium]